MRINSDNGDDDNFDGVRLKKKFILLVLYLAGSASFCLFLLHATHITIEYI